MMIVALASLLVSATMNGEVVAAQGCYDCLWSSDCFHTVDLSWNITMTNSYTVSPGGMSQWQLECIAPIVAGPLLP